MPYDVASDRLEVPLLPLKNVVVFPRTIVNLNIGHVRSLNAANLALAGDHYMVVTAVKSGESEDPSPADLYTVGTLVEVHAVRPQSENTAQVEVEALRRVVIQLIKGRAVTAVRLRHHPEVSSVQVDIIYVCTTQ